MKIHLNKKIMMTGAEKLKKEFFLHNIRALYHRRNILITAMKESAITN